MKTFKQAFIESLCDHTSAGSNVRFLSYGCYITGSVFIFIYPHEWYGGLSIIALGLGIKIAQKRLSETKSK